MSKITSETTDDGRIADELSRDERYDLLAAERRRVALSVLSERDAPLALDDLAAAVAGRQADGGAPDEDAVERTAVSLHHVHLPRMADVGVIEYDVGSRRVDAVGSLPGAQAF